MPRLTFLLVLILPAAVWSQGRQPPAVLLEPHVTITAEAFRFRSFEDDHQGFYVIWPQPENGLITLRAQHIDAQGNSLWDPEKSLVSGIATTTSWEAGPDSKGGVLVTWEKDNQVFIQRFGPAGASLWPSKNERLSVSTSTQQSPVLTADGSGGAYGVWEETPVTSRRVLMAQHINAMGAPLWSSQGTRVSLRPSNQTQPRVVYDGMAGIIVVWQDFRESASQLQVQRLNYQGNRLWGLEGLLVTAPAGDPTRPPYLGAVGQGSSVLAWQASSGATYRIFVQRVGASGKLDWNPEGMEMTVGTWDEWNPVLHGDGDGGTWIAWEDYRNSQNWVAYVKHLHLNGQSGWPGAEVPLTTIERIDQGHIGMTDDGLGGVIAAWVDNRNGTVGIYLQEINDKGELLQGPEGVKVADHMINPRTPQINSLGNGGIGISWADNPVKGTWTLYWKQVNLKS